MAANPRPPVAVELTIVPPIATAPALGPMLAAYRRRCGLSQNQLARAAGVDPAYINRLERDTDGVKGMPSRRVVLSIWEALVDFSRFIHEAPGPIGPLDRDRLLSAAGLIPQIVLEAGGWDAYTTRIRSAFLGGLTRTLEAFDAAQSGADA